MCFQSCSRPDEREVCCQRNAHPAVVPNLLSNVWLFNEHGEDHQWSAHHPKTAMPFVRV